MAVRAWFSTRRRAFTKPSAKAQRFFSGPAQTGLPDNNTHAYGDTSLKHLILLVAVAALAAGCGHDRHRHDRDRDHNGIPDRYERNRDGDRDRDGIPDRYDRRPYDPRRY